MSRLNHWEEHAKNWDLVGPPLRPSPVDVRVFERIAANAPRAGLELKAVLLGSTQELVCMRWPAHSCLQIVERCRPMLERLFAPEAAPPGPDVVVQRIGDWRSMSMFAQGSQDLVLGDGCFTTLTCEEYDRVLFQIYRVLRPGGIFSHRFFLQEVTREQPIDVLENWTRSLPVEFHAHKLRLLMSLQQSFEHGVEVRRAWEMWEEKVAHEIECAPELAKTIEAYSDSDAVYTFPTATELKEKLSPLFHVDLVNVPTGYALAERCPTVMCTRKEDET